MNFIAESFKDSSADLLSRGPSDEGRFERRRLHRIYQDTLQSYHEPTSDWSKDFSRRFLQTVWENYRASWRKERHV